MDGRADGDGLRCGAGVAGRERNFSGAGVGIERYLKLTPTWS